MPEGALCWPGEGIAGCGVCATGLKSWTILAVHVVREDETTPKSPRNFQSPSQMSEVFLQGEIRRMTVNEEARSGAKALLRCPDREALMAARGPN